MLYEVITRAINILSAARLFLFGARDVWFVVALPVYLAATFGWDFWQVGGFLALWVIGYGFVQSFAPYLTGKRSGRVPDGRSRITSYNVCYTKLLRGIPFGGQQITFDLMRQPAFGGFCFAGTKPAHC